MQNGITACEQVALSTQPQFHFNLSECSGLKLRQGGWESSRITLFIAFVSLDELFDVVTTTGSVLKR